MRIKAFVSSAAALVACWATPASAGGDLLVAPTRVVMDGARGTEVILNNIDSVPATYRISLEVRRMKADGTLEELATEAANELEKKTLAMITYAPKKVVLAPNQPQSVRIGVRPPSDLPDGEYRVHMLFRAIPDSKPVTAQPQTSGLSISITPIYGVTIPIIVRKGSLKATAAISNPRLTSQNGRSELAVDIARTGARSTYGKVVVYKPGIAKPVFEAKGIAVYPEVGKRSVLLPIPNEMVTALTGPATIQYVEDAEAGGKVMAEVQAVIK